jgi:serine/threonine-protein kinase
VWLARLRAKRQFDELVAIKVSRFGRDARVEQMLLDEARITSAIEHENVVRILDYGESNELVYIAMEWIDGDPLSALLRVLEKKQLTVPLAVALRIVSDLCAAAHAAHEVRGPDGEELGVVHRDISPQNVVITRTGRVKLIDFGIAKFRDRSVGDTEHGKLKGKLHYMAPEQAFGGPIDRRTDVFALGAVLFRLIADRAPYEAEGELDTLRLLRRGAEVDVPGYIPPLVRRILEKALARSPDARFGSALEMQRALTAAMAVMDPFFTRARVASFVREHLQTHVASRRRAVELALRAADERSDTEIDIPIEFTYASSVRGRDSDDVDALTVTRMTERRRLADSTKQWTRWVAACTACNLCLIVIGILVLQARLPTNSKASGASVDVALCHR